MAQKKKRTTKQQIDVLNAQMQGLKSGLTNQRSFENNYDEWRRQQVDGYDNYDYRELTTLSRAIGMSNAEVNAAKGHSRILSAGVESYHFPDTESTSLEKKARDEIARLDEYIFGSNGFNGLSGTLSNEGYVTGEAAVEWIPNKLRTGLLKAKVLLSEDLDYKVVRGSNLLRWKHKANWSKGFISTISSNEGWRELNPITFHHIALNPIADTYRGESVIIGALKEIWRQDHLKAGEDRILKTLETLALIIVTLAEPPDMDSYGCDKPDCEEEFNAKVRKQTTILAELISARSDNGLTVLPYGVETTALNTTANLAGIEQITLPNKRAITSAIHSAMFMQGHTDITQALARVVYPIVRAAADEVIRIVNRQLIYGIQLHLRLKNIRVGRVEIRRKTPTHPFILDEANAAFAQAKADDLNFKSYGEEYRKRELEKRGLPNNNETTDSTDKATTR